MAAHQKTLGQLGYEAYAQHTDWKSLATGCALPAWDNLSAAIQNAWEVASNAVSSAVRDGVTAYPDSSGA